MLSSEITERDLSARAEMQLRALLEPLPMQIGTVAREKNGADLVMELSGPGGPWTLVCEFKSNAQPRHVRGAALQARDLARQIGKTSPVYPIVLAPFISKESAAICQELDVGYADLAGNCRLAFGTVYIEKSVASNPFKEKREQRSLFAPKSARILRLMLGAPGRAWKVAELAEHADMSYGQVSKVRTYLIDQEWASGTWGAVRLVKPQALLESWRKIYKSMRRKRTTYYTLLHGDSLHQSIRYATGVDPVGKVLLSSYSAARWLAPYARVAGEYFYADETGERWLKEKLKLESVAKGENITIDIASDDGVFQDRIEAAPGLFCTSPIQTYLDLAASGERGEEAAQHLYDNYIAPHWMMTS